MEKKDISILLRKVFRYKELTAKKRWEVMSALESIKERDPLYYYSNAGKLCTLFGPIDAAIEYLEKASELENNNATVYYNLYKCYVRKGDFNRAFMNLYDCMERNTIGANFELPMAMLSSLIDMDLDFYEFRSRDYSVEVKDKFCFNEMNDPVLKNMYEELIILFNNRQYGEVVKKIGQMKGHIDNIKLPMEVDTLLLISRELVKKENAKYREIVGGEIDLSMNTDDYLAYITDLMIKGLMSVKRLLQEIEKLAKVDLDKALRLLDMVCELDEVNVKSYEINYLRNLINERLCLSRLDENVKSRYKDLIKQAKEAFHSNKNQDALLLFEEAYIITGYTVCEYYMGKCLFKMGRINQAKEYFDLYLTHGGEKVDKCLLYMVGICDMRKWDSKEYVGWMMQIHDSFDRDYKYVPRNKKDNKDFDRDKHRMSKKLVFSEGDFISNEVLVEDYYDTDIDGKLSIIKNLFRRGQVDVANKLLEELNKSCAKEEKGKVLQMIRNKKLYMNQKVTN